MTLEQFNIQLSRLKNVFGDRNYPDERVKIIFSEVRNIDDSYFRKSIDELIGNSRYAPLIPEFREIISRSKEIKQAQDRQSTVFNVDYNRTYICAQCDDSGITLIDQVGALPFAYKCYCHRGRGRPENYPVYYPSNTKENEI